MTVVLREIPSDAFSALREVGIYASGVGVLCIEYAQSCIIVKYDDWRLLHGPEERSSGLFLCHLVPPAQIGGNDVSGSGSPLSSPVTWRPGLKFGLLANSPRLLPCHVEAGAVSPLR